MQVLQAGLCHGGTLEADRSLFLGALMPLLRPPAFQKDLISSSDGGIKPNIRSCLIYRSTSLLLFPCYLPL